MQFRTLMAWPCTRFLPLSDSSGCVLSGKEMCGPLMAIQHIESPKGARENRSRREILCLLGLPVPGGDLSVSQVALRNRVSKDSIQVGEVSRTQQDAEQAELAQCKQT